MKLNLKILLLWLRNFIVITKGAGRIAEVAKKRFQSGRLAREDLKAAEIDFRNAETEHIQAQAEQVQNEQTLTRWKLTLSILEFWSLNEIRIWLSDFKWNEANLDNLPQVRNSFLDRQRLKALASSEKRKLYASLGSNLTGGWTKIDSGAWTKTWEAGLEIRVPLFERWKTMSTFTMYEREADAAEQTLEANRQKSLSEIIAEQEGLRILLGLLENRHEIMRVTTEIYQLKLQRFESGRVSVNDLSNDLSRLLQSELLTLSAERDLALAFIQLAHALGQDLTDL